MMRICSRQIEEFYHPVNEQTNSVKSLRIGTQSNASVDRRNSSEGCRLCGGARGLHNLGDSCVWENVEDRYDQVIADSFNVTVSPNSGKICDRCIVQLRNAQKFKSLVYAAFNKASDTTLQTIVPTEPIDMNGNLPGPIREILKNSRNQSDANEKILQLLKKKLENDSRKKNSYRRLKRSVSFPTEVASVNKRVIARCSCCGHRYPMIIQSESMTRLFICSRCKLKKSRERMYCRKCTAGLPPGSIRNHANALRTKNDPRSSGNVRTSSTRCSNICVPKRALNEKSERPNRCCNHNLTNKTSAVQSHPILNHKSLCSNVRYVRKKSNITERVRTSHTNSDFVCGICKKDLRTRNLLDQHMSVHSAVKVYECDICRRVFKNENSLQVHYLMHDSFKKK